MPKAKRFGAIDREMHWPKLIGAFIVFAALVMFIRAGAQMFDSWDALKSYPECVSNISTDDAQLAQLQFMDCKQSLYNATGLQLKGDQARITTRQFWFALLGPIASVLFWAIVFIFGLMFYSRSSRWALMCMPAAMQMPEKWKARRK